MPNDALFSEQWYLQQILSTQRIVRHCVRIAPLIEFRVLDLRIRPQPLERCRNWLTGTAGCTRMTWQSLGNRAGPRAASKPCAP